MLSTPSCPKMAQHTLRRSCRCAGGSEYRNPDITNGGPGRKARPCGAGNRSRSRLVEANDETYGYRRLHAALVRGGEQASDELVRQLIREIGRVPCQPKPRRRSLTAQDATAGPIPDLVNRDFTAENPGDITCIFTWEGWLYRATVINCATRKLIGWAMDDNYKTPLIGEAIKMAARNLDLPEGAIFHSDRGSNYTSAEFAGVLKASMSGSLSAAPASATITLSPNLSMAR
jgi:transposase InsO family protein